MPSLKQIYTAKCEELGVRKNSSVSDLLEHDDSDLRCLDLSVNIVGVKGLLPVLDVCRHAKGLKTLNLSNNMLSSPAAVEISKALMGHPSLTTIDVSNNHLPLGGEPLLALAKASPALTKVHLADTLVRPLFVKLIDYQLAHNAKGAAKGGNNDGGGGGGCGATAEAAEGAALAQFTLGAGACAEESDEDRAGGAEEDDAHSGASADEDDDDDDDEGAASSGSDMDEAQERELQERQRAMLAGGGRRKTVSSEVISQQDMATFRPKVVSKAEEHKAWLMKTLEGSQLFSHLEDDELTLTVGAMEEEVFGKGDVIVEEGAEGSKVFVVYEGEAEESKGGATVRRLAEGDLAGETDVLYAFEHDTSVSVLSETLHAFSLDRSTYRHIVTKSSDEKRRRYSGLLQKVSFLKNLNNQELLQLADCLKTALYNQGDTIIQHGSEGRWFHIILDGEVEVIGRKDGQEVQVCTFTVGHCVGELEFINHHVCVADVKALSATTRTAKMNRKHFEKVMGKCTGLLRENAQTNEVYGYYRETQK
eukprot:Rhum_TRINITY_DN13682_c0_g1::Rhum_TRINITY_DN13682_c0_g1_i1::g.62769::m.62769/K04739/PRKAR; cAMP-dependent protein kinase regulator